MIKERMRITIPHQKPKQEVVQAVDRTIDDLFGGFGIKPLEITDQHKSWNGSVMTFSLTAKMGFLKNPICGTVEVTESDVTIDADLGMLGKFFPEEKVKTALETRVRGLLTAPRNS